MTIARTEPKKTLDARAGPSPSAKRTASTIDNPHPLERSGEERSTERDATSRLASWRHSGLVQGAANSLALVESRPGAIKQATQMHFVRFTSRTPFEVPEVLASPSPRLASFGLTEVARFFVTQEKLRLFPLALKQQSALPRTGRKPTIESVLCVS